MDPGLVRVVCASCGANYRLTKQAVVGKIVDFRCSKCDVLVEVNGVAIELVAPTRLGREPEPNHATVAAETPAVFAQTKPPPPPSEATTSATANAAIHSSMPPPISLPLREAAPSTPEHDAFLESPIVVEPKQSRKTWMAFATLLVAVLLGVLGKAIGSSPQSSATAAPSVPQEDERDISNRMQPVDLRGVSTDRAAQPPSTATPSPANAIASETRLKPKPARSRKGLAAEAPAPPEEQTSAPSVAPEPVLEPRTFEAPEPEPPVVEFNNDAARSTLEDAAERAAICRDTDTQAGVVRVAVTFAPTGRVTSAVVESGPLLGTPAGGCVASKFRSARVPAFAGARVTVHKTVSF